MWQQAARCQQDQHPAPCLSGSKLQGPVCRASHAGGGQQSSACRPACPRCLPAALPVAASIAVLAVSTHPHFLPSVALASLCLQLLYRHCLPSVVPVAACAPSGSQQCCACRFLHTCSLQTLAGSTIGKNTRISDIVFTSAVDPASALPHTACRSCTRTAPERCTPAPRTQYSVHQRLSGSAAACSRRWASPAPLSPACFPQAPTCLPL